MWVGLEGCLERCHDGTGDGAGSGELLTCSLLSPWAIVMVSVCLAWRVKG